MQPKETDIQRTSTKPAFKILDRTCHVHSTRKAMKIVLRRLCCTFDLVWDVKKRSTNSPPKLHCDSASLPIHPLLHHSTQLSATWFTKNSNLTQTAKTATCAAQNYKYAQNCTWISFQPAQEESSELKSVGIKIHQ